VLAGFRGDWHSGYDPRAHRTSTQSTPLATQALHAVGYAMAAKLKGESIATVTFLGDGASSEGDTHEAFNFAGVWQAPTVFIVQNNQFAISVPLSKQTRARTLADRALGYGIPGYNVDGKHAAAVYAVVAAALDRARNGEGPTIVECLTYRIEAHTNSDDPSRYRGKEDVAVWKGRDPIERLERYLVSEDALSDEVREQIAAEAEELAAATREAMSAEPVVDPLEIFDHLYASPRAALLEQRAFLAGELERHGEV
jgi:pyruvate dehydrogenase E1 component alpha subunit